MDWKWFLFSFKGRINRKPFWLFILFLAALFMILELAVNGRISSERNMISTFLSLAFLWPGLAVQVKRWHDRNKSGWWVLINLVPLIGPLWSLVETGVLEGTEGENRFGKDPLEGVEEKSVMQRQFTEKESLLMVGILGLFGFGLFLWAVVQVVTR